MRDLLFLQQRAWSLLADCDYCGKPKGEVCVNPLTKHELEHQAAHFVRITAGQKVTS